VRMELRQYRTNRASGLFIPAVASPIDRAKSLVGAFHEDRIVAVCQRALRPAHTTSASAPHRAAPRQGQRDLEHGGCARRAVCWWA
jgi:hypothetical protein